MAAEYGWALHTQFYEGAQSSIPLDFRQRNRKGRARRVRADYSFAVAITMIRR